MQTLVYGIQKDREGWSVCASRTGKPVLLDGQPQTGLSLEVASQLAASLEIMDFLRAERATWMITNCATVH
ncbi:MULTISPECIES: hypothetical protein [unclassified Methylobacterium]|uniref:hypothetical protein n=1 Tax=unclassified Methylobacterium TaxID=2615210 RepID=UPI000A014FEE|nr:MULTISPECIES: hypothetical protein [Methylobacterium]WFT83392.1 hypothetical protein QA634_16825 [Methylobacterium nodulans]